MYIDPHETSSFIHVSRLRTRIKKNRWRHLFICGLFIISLYNLYNMWHPPWNILYITVVVVVVTTYNVQPYRCCRYTIITIILIIIRILYYIVHTHAYIWLDWWLRKNTYCYGCYVCAKLASYMFSNEFL